MSTNGTQPTRVCVWELALEAWIARSERPPNLVEDGVFAVYLRSQKSPQAFRYLRRWIADGWSEASLVSYEEIAASLAEERVIASLKGKGLTELTELATRAQNAKRDLNKAFDAYRDVLSNGKATQPDASGEAPKPGGKVVRPSRKTSTPKPSVGGKAPLDDGGSR